MRIILTLSISLILGFTSVSQELLTMEDYLDFESTSSPQISPDGTQVLYTRSWINAVDDKRESDLWIINVDGEYNRLFTKGSNGLWSPDGKKVAFVKEGEPGGNQIFVKYVGMDGEPTQITRLENSPGNIKWSPDGKYIAFTSFVPKPDSWNIDLPSKPDGAKWTEAPKIVDKPVYRRDRVGYFEDGYTHIFIVPSGGGTARQITSDDWNHDGQLDWTPDSRKIIFSALRVPDPEYVYRESALYSVDVNSREIEQLTDRKGGEYSPSVSPDGSKIAFIGNEWTENWYHASNGYILDLTNSKITRFTDGLDRNIGNLTWDKDSKGLYYNVEDQGTENLYYSTTGGKWKQVTEGNHFFTTYSMSDGGVAAGVFSSYQQPRDIAVVQNGEVRLLTNVNADILDFKKLGEVEEVRYTSTDDLEIQGWLVKPPNFDPKKKYPLILKIHGGPHGMYDVEFDFTYQLHAAEGYLVLYTNPRGSTGYGYDFANAIQNSYPGKDYDDLMNGVDEIIKRGIVDENKMYVYGGSGGGVLTSWIVGKTDRFAAASVNFPVINWISFVGTTDGLGWYKNFEKFPWEDITEHWERSPLKYVGNVSTPTMLMTGVKDLRTPIAQTEEFYQALQMRKVPSVMIRFNDEFHGTGSNPSNYLRTVGYLHHWFGKYEKNDMSTSVNTDR